MFPLPHGGTFDFSRLSERERFYRAFQAARIEAIEQYRERYGKIAADDFSSELRLRYTYRSAQEKGRRRKNFKVWKTFRTNSLVRSFLTHQRYAGVFNPKTQQDSYFGRETTSAQLLRQKRRGKRATTDLVVWQATIINRHNPELR